MKSTMEEQLDLIKQKCDTDRTVADTNLMMLGMIQKLAENKEMDPNFQNMLATATQKVTEQTKAAYSKKAALDGTKVMAHIYEHRLQKPPIVAEANYDMATLKKLEPRNVLQAVKYFNPDTQSNSVDFSDTWRHIISYTQRLKLTEQTYIEILLMVMQGSAHKVVFDMVENESSLDDILDILSSLYVKKKTILDDMREINSFKRKANEPLLSTMARARILMEKLKHMYTPYAWPEHCERSLTQILKQVITPATRRHIDLEEANKFRIGVPADYTTLVEMADTYEAAHDQIPKVEMATTVGGHSGVPSAPPDMVSPPSELLVTKLENLENIVLNAIDPKDRRNVKERTKSKSRDKSRNSSRERSRKDLFERQIKQYAKLEDEEKKSKSSSSSKPKSDYYESGYDRKKDKKREEKRNRSDSKTIDKYLSRSRSSDSESRDASTSRGYDTSRSRSRSRSSYGGHRSSSQRSRSRSPFRYSDSKNQNYHEKERTRKSSQRNSYNKSGRNNYRNKSPHPNKHSGDYKNRPKKNISKKEIYENYPKLKNKRHGPNGELTGFTIENNYYIQCTRPSCQQAHLEGTKCNLN